jgi:hypothetical protein
MRKNVRRLTAGALLLGALAFCPATSFAQGKSQNAHGHASPPSSSVLPGGSIVGPSSGAAPLAWMDDASLIEPGAMSVAVYTTRWMGAGASESSIPVVDVGLGITDRLQFTASVPRVAGSSDPAAPSGGLGTTYFSGKYAAYANDRARLRIAVAPTLEVLSARATAALAPGQTRAQFGLPVSVQLDRTGRSMYASAGWFSRGAWFAGAGGAMQLSPRVGVSASLSHAWAGTVDPVSALARQRTELSGGTSFAATSHIALFASAGRTINTSDENGAGTTIAGGVSFYVSPPRATHPTHKP